MFNIRSDNPVVPPHYRLFYRRPGAGAPRQRRQSCGQRARSQSGLMLQEKDSYSRVLCQIRLILINRLS